MDFQDQDISLIICISEQTNKQNYLDNINLNLQTKQCLQVDDKNKIENHYQKVWVTNFFAQGLAKRVK